MSNQPDILEQFYGACILVGEPDSDFGRWAERALLPSVRAAGICSTTAWWTSGLLRERADQSEAAVARYAIVRELVAAPVVAVDVSPGDWLTSYILGAREALSSGVTLACQKGPTQHDRIIGPFFADIDAETEQSLGERLAQRFPRNGSDKLLDRLTGLHEPPPTSAWPNAFRASRAVRVAAEPEILLRDGRIKQQRGRANPRDIKQEPQLWRPSQNAAQTPPIGIAFGEIENVVDIPCWVNPENAQMQMARVTEKSISAIVRARGARWTGFDRQHSDDAMYVALAREMGSRSRLSVGEVLMTSVQPNTELFRTNGVRAVAHVAAVEPIGAGMGFRVGGDLRRCVKNALTEVQKYAAARSLKLGSVLLPLLAAGDGGMLPETSAAQVVSALSEWVHETPSTPKTIHRVYLLARDTRARNAITQALYAHAFEPA